MCREKESYVHGGICASEYGLTPTRRAPLLFASQCVHTLLCHLCYSSLHNRLCHSEALKGLPIATVLEVSVIIPLGEVNNHLIEYEQSILDEPSQQKLANSMMVIMVRGLFSRLEFPYVQFPCKAVTGDLLYNPFWEAVCRLERCGFRVMAATADGASPNRRLIKLHGCGKELVHKVSNPYAIPEERYLFFFSDVPHLLKTTRNAWASKKCQLCVRNLCTYARFFT